MLGNLVIAGHGIQPEPSSNLLPEEETCTVVRGDYLVLLVELYETDWKTLVAINNLTYSYSLYPDQALKLPEKSACTPTGLGISDRDQDHPGCVTDEDGNKEVTCSVKPGDHLSEVAYQLGQNWQQLASYNNISFP